MKFEITTAKLILSKTPFLLKTYLSNLPDEWIFQNEGGDTWSPYDIVGHYIIGEQTDWIPRAKLILSAEMGKINTFTPFDRFAQFENSKGKSLDDLLNEFETLRKANLEELDNLEITPETLQKKGIHPELGEVTLSQLLSCWVTHDLNHIGQISRVLAKNYKNEVGVWTQYISILNQ